MPDEYPVEIPEAFQLDSGLREDMILAVHSAYFAPHADYMEGKQLMLWLLGTDENIDPVELRMSIGSDWTTDDGNVISHPTKKLQHVNKTSIYGFWLADCYRIPELTRVLFERGEALGNVGPRDARIWMDLILHLQIRELSWGKNSSVPSQDRLMPTEYLGMTTDQPSIPTTPDLTINQVPPIVAPVPPTTTPTPAAPTPAEAVAAARAQAQASTNGSPLYVRALELAKSSPDFPSFLALALADSEILADDELAVQCADQSQIWASAH